MLLRVGVIQADTWTGRFVYANIRWCQMTGLAPDAVLGREWAEIIHPDDREAFRGAWTRLREYGVSISLEFRYLAAFWAGDLGAATQTVGIA